MRLKPSYRNNIVKQSEIRNMSIECERVNGLNLSQGICDLETPLEVKVAAKEAIDEGMNHYTRFDGLLELRKAVAKKMMKYNKIKADPEKNIIISGGATGAFYCACLALLDPGDEVIIFEPYYGYHISTLRAVGVNPIFVKLNPPDWHFDINELKKKVTKKTKGIMINTPANPSGKVFTKDELKQLSEFCLKHNLFIFTDEIYEYFVYGNNQFISPGSLSEIADRTITISGYSKTFSTTGWRIGYTVCQEKWAKLIGYMNDLIYVCAPAPLQMGIANGINKLSESFYVKLCGLYQKKRDVLCSNLREIGLTPHVPQGAYYVLADVSVLPGKGSKEKAMYLLKKTGVATVPGSAFYHGKGGENLVRFCFAKEDQEIEEACKRLKKL